MKRHHFFLTILILLSSAAKTQAQVETNIVFEERFDIENDNYSTCGKFAPLPTGGTHGVTTYRYAYYYGDNTSSNWLSCGTSDHYCDINEEEYAIVKSSDVSWWCSRTIVNEHTKNGTSNSGAMLVNAAANTNQYFYTLKLEGLCPNTQYDFSAWYVSLANSDENPSNIYFEIYEGGNLDVLTGFHTGGTPITSGNTGNFGGTAGSNPNAASFVWRQKTISFPTPSNLDPATKYFLKLKNNLGDWNGNDLMIDDIVVTKYAPTIYLYEAGTTNTSKQVCTDNEVELSVELTAAIAATISGTGKVYYRLMSSTDQTVWTPASSVQTTTTDGGILLFTVFPPANNTVFYRVKLSTDSLRAANVDSTSGEGCYNDVITQKFSLIRVGDLNINIEFPKQICADDANFVLNVSYSGSSSVTYSIIFDEKAIDEHFANQNGTVSGNSINVPVPADVRPDTYSGSVLFTEGSLGCQKEMTFTFDVRYPSKIMEQKWHDVIALLDSNHNGGYAFTEYQWYKNQQIMTGETWSYIYLNDKALSSADCYAVEVTRKDGSKMLSCCLFPKDDPICCDDIPKVFQGNGNLIISSVSQNVTVRLWTVTGILLQSQNINNRVDFEIAAPSQQGVYLLEIVAQDKSKRNVFPIVIR